MITLCNFLWMFHNNTFFLLLIFIEHFPCHLDGEQLNGGAWSYKSKVGPRNKVMCQ